MKKLLTVAAAVMAVSTASFANEQGKTLFQQKGCTACHQAAEDRTGPALKKIAAAYAGKEADLINYLKGNGKAIVWPEKEAIMKPQLNTTKAMKAEELKALAGYILSNK